MPLLFRPSLQPSLADLLRDRVAVRLFAHSVASSLNQFFAKQHTQALLTYTSHSDDSHTVLLLD